MADTVVGITLKQLADSMSSMKSYVDAHDVQSDWNETNTSSLAFIKNKIEGGSVDFETDPIDFEHDWNV